MVCRSLIPGIEGEPLISIRKFPGRLITFWLWLLILVGFPLAGHGQTQPSTLSRQRSAHAAQAGDRTFPALLVSDIHFDPFHDPAKYSNLLPLR